MAEPPLDQQTLAPVPRHGGVRFAAIVLSIVLVATIGAIYLKHYAGEVFRRNMRQVIEEEAWSDASNIRLRMDRIACEQTARFVIENMPKVPAFRDRFALLDHSIKS